MALFHFNKVDRREWIVDRSLGHAGADRCVRPYDPKDSIPHTLTTIPFTLLAIHLIPTYTLDTQPPKCFNVVNPDGDFTSYLRVTK